MELVQQRKAMLTQAHSSGRALCHYCGKCNGCCVDAKYTSANTPIPQGLRTGNLTLVREARDLYLDASVASVPYPVMDRMEGFLVECYDGSKWVRSWDTALNNTLPKGLRVTVHVEEDGKPVEFYILANSRVTGL